MATAPSVSIYDFMRMLDDLEENISLLTPKVKYISLNVCMFRKGESRKQMKKMLDLDWGNGIHSFMEAENHIYNCSCCNKENNETDDDDDNETTEKCEKTENPNVGDD